MIIGEQPVTVDYPESTASSAELAAPPPPDVSVVVRALLEMSLLTPSEAEIEKLVTAYASARIGVRKLYAVPEARREQPALVFRAIPGTDDAPEASW
jgi:hypothetical protein